MDSLAQVDIGTRYGAKIGQDIGVGNLVSNTLSAAIVIAGILTLFLFALGGFNMLAGAGQNNPDQAAKGRQAAMWGAIGFGVIFAAYWLIQLIETITGSTFITDPFKYLK